MSKTCLSLPVWSMDDDGHRHDTMRVHPDPTLYDRRMIVLTGLRLGPTSSVCWCEGGLRPLFRSLLCASIVALGLAMAAGARAATDLDSMSGAYLASRAAAYQGDMEARADFLSQALEHRPEDVTLLGQTYKAMVSAGRIDEAAELARHLADMNVVTELSPVTLLLDAFAADDADATDDALAKFGSDGPLGTLALIARAWATAQEGDHARALGVLMAGMPGNASFVTAHRAAMPDVDPLIVYHLALLSDAAGEAEMAETAFSEAMEAGEAVTWETTRAYGGFLERLGRGEEAAGLYRRFMEINPESPWFEEAALRALAGGAPPERPDAFQAITDTLAETARQLFGERRGTAALALLNHAAWLQPADDRIHFMTGDVLSRLQYDAASAAAYGRVAPDSPLAWNALLRRVRSLNNAGFTEDAITLGRVLSQERPESADPFMAIGDVLRAHRRWDEAVEAYDEALHLLDERSYRRPELLFDLGAVLELTGQWERAEQAFLESLESRPDDPWLLNYLGYSWADRNVNLDEALDLIERALERTPNDGMVIDSLGWVLYRLGRYDEAVVELERAVGLEPAEAVIIDHLGDAYWKTGRYYEARFQWRHVLTLAPDDEDLVDAVRRKLEVGLDDGGQ